MTSSNSSQSAIFFTAHSRILLDQLGLPISDQGIALLSQRAREHRREWEESPFRESLVKAAANMSAILGELDWNRLEDMNIGFAEDLLSTLRMFSRSESISQCRKRLNRYGEVTGFFSALETLLDRGQDLEIRVSLMNALPGVSMSLTSHFLFLFDPHCHALLTGEITTTLKSLAGWNEEILAQACSALAAAFPELTRQAIAHLALDWLAMRMAALSDIDHSGQLVFLLQNWGMVPQVPLQETVSPGPAKTASPAADTKSTPPTKSTSATASPAPLSEPRSLVQTRRSVRHNAELAGFISRVEAQGYIFSRELIYNLHLSIAAKPFVILSGVSGTGKTRLAQLYARHMTRDLSRQGYVVMAVKPEFSRSSDILGSVEESGAAYLASPALKVILNALRDPENPYFLILDEMNIAQAELYFADFLSAMESGEPIHLHGSPRCLPQAEALRHGRTEPFVCNRDCDQCFFCTGGIPQNNSEALETLVPPMIALPGNLVIIGTVNVDETVRTFSPKLIDRANTIDFYHVDIPALEEQTHQGKFRDQARILEDIQRILRPYSLHFGYRTATEVFRYLEMAEEAGADCELSRDSLLDLQITQKVLPKFHGKADRLKRPLEELFVFASGRESAGEGMLREVILQDPNPAPIGSMPLPRTAFKAAIMLISLIHTGRAGYLG